VEFDGKGRETDNINGATGLGLIDIDGSQITYLEVGNDLFTNWK